MFESFALIILGLVGGVSSLMGTLPTLLVAMFGDTSRLTVAGDTTSPKPSIPGTLIGLPAPADPGGQETLDDVVYKVVKDISSPTGYIWAFDHIITQEPESATAAEQAQTSAQAQALQAYAGGTAAQAQAAVSGSSSTTSTPTGRVFGAGINPVTGGNQ
jgi:hypothetical protein